MKDPLLEEMELMIKQMGSKPKKKRRHPEPDDYIDDPPGGLAAEKMRKDIEKTSLDIAIKKRELVEKDRAIRIMNDISQTFQTVVIDTARRDAPVMAAMAKNPGVERDFEMFLSNRNRDMIRSVKAVINQNVQDGKYE